MIAASLSLAAVTVSTLTGLPEHLTSGGAPLRTASTTGQQSTADTTPGPTGSHSSYQRDAPTSGNRDNPAGTPNSGTAGYSAAPAANGAGQTATSSAQATTKPAATTTVTTTDPATTTDPVNPPPSTTTTSTTPQQTTTTAPPEP